MKKAGSFKATAKAATAFKLKLVSRSAPKVSSDARARIMRVENAKAEIAKAAGTRRMG